MSVDFYIFDFSRTTWLILSRLGTNHRGGILNCSNEGDCLSPRGDISERVKIHLTFFKIFSRTSRPISILPCTNHPCIKRILKGQVLFKGEIIAKMG
jgi:hypothetical protein